jgi:alkylation response protein AidB-like acyl-CoA dehydrogenase
VSSPDRSRSAATALERALGNPLDDHRAGSFANAVAADREDRFPEQLYRLMFEWGFAEHLVPAELGGKLASVEGCFALSRVLSRRDLTAAISIGASTLASIPVWLRGTAAQKEQVARILRRGDSLAFALSERDHGADVAATEVTARRTGAGDWRIDGTKWPINNAGNAAGMAVTARTGTGMRGLTLFFLESEATESERWARLPKIRTHGVRGSRLGGIQLTDLPVSADAVVGNRGEGLEIILKTLQISRVLVASLALGALDTCLSATLSFARARRLYRAPIVDLQPVVRRLTDAYADLLIGETVALMACRAAHVCPGQLPLMSACVKYLVPQTANDSIESLSVVLGARSYLAEDHWHGIFDKMRRDCSVTSLFDGSSPVNLSSIASQLPALVRARRAGAVTEPAPSLFARDTPDLPWIEEAQLDLATDVDAVHGGVAAARRAIQRGDALTAHRTALLAVLQDLESEADRLDAEVDHHLADTDWRRSGAAYDLAARYSHLHAAGACAWKWLSWRNDSQDEFMWSGAWLLLCLRRLATRIGAEPAPLDAVEEAALGRLHDTFDPQRMFSDVDLDQPLATTQREVM